MGIKSDRWIWKMATEQHMIDSFVDGQVRDGVILMEYLPTDMTFGVADEFKIFTNVYSAIVDPKNFDSHSMVDFRGMFALSLRTLLHLRVQWNISASRLIDNLCRQKHIRALRHHLYVTPLNPNGKVM